MSEARAAAKMAALLLRSLAARGEDVDALERAFGMSRSQTSGWVGWEAFCDLLDEAEARVGGAAGLVELGRMVEKPGVLGPLRWMMSGALGPRPVYRLMFRWQGPSAFPTIAPEWDEDPGGFDLRLSIAPDLRASAAFFHWSRGAFEATPHLLGLPSSLVEAEIGPRDARYRIVPPPSRSLWARMRRIGAVVRGSDAALDELVAQHESLREAHEARTATEERFRRLAESAGEMIAEWGADGRCLWVSQNVERLLGWTREEFLADPVGLLHPEDASEAMARLGERFREGGSGSMMFRLRDREGGWHWLDNTSNVTTTPRGELRVVTVSRDVTRRRSLEDQLRQAQKMEAVGRLAGGIAHDFNNILTVIKGWCVQLPEGEAVEQIRSATDRAAALTRRLLTISRRQPMALHPMRIESCIASMEPLLRRTMGDDIELRVRIATELPAVQADLGSLEQVILNLAINARDAMPEGGVLEVSAEEAEIAAGSRHKATPGDYVALRIRDDGLGMDAATQARVFEPFFSTKEPGRGSGLGLAMVWGIVHQMGGEVHLRSSLGEGSTFTLLLPVAVGEPARPEDEVPGHVAATTGVERLLVVEDETAVRELAAIALADCGFLVETAADADEALRRFDRLPRMDLLVTDVQMPGRSGFELADELERRGIDLPILFVSGYADGMAEERERLDGNLLPKPYSPDDLVDRVRRLLDEDRRSGRRAVRRLG